MSTVPSDDSTIIFCIDTEQYAGNFERPMVAWITGQVGECGVGKEAASAAQGELSSEALEWFVDHVVSEPDENRCRRPATIWPTPGWFNDGMGGHYRDGTDPEIVRVAYNAKVEDHATNHIEKIYANKDYAKKDAQRFRDEHMDKPTRHPAYMSVACFIDEIPPPEILALMQELARSYHQWAVKSGRRFDTAPTVITGFRLLRRTTSYTSCWPMTP